MEDALRAGLLLFALLTALSAVPVVLRRLRPPTLLATHGLGLLVVLALVVTAALGRGDARPLFLPYLVSLALTAVSAAGPGGARPTPPGLLRAGLLVGLAGALASGASALLGPLPDLVLPALALLALSFGGAAAALLVSRGRRADSAGQRSSDLGAGVGAACGALGVAGALWLGAFGAGLWSALLGLAAALVTSARVFPFQPPPAREVVSALFVGLALLFPATLQGDDAAALALGAQGALVTLAVLAGSRPLLLARTSRAPARQGSSALEEDATPLAEAALAHMTPILDDGLLFRPSRPRVHARVTAKRLLESALERARSSQPPGRRANLNVEVREDDADVDVEGDPGELAEALCAVLDNALTLKNEHPGLFVRVHVRGSPGHVTFEVTDDLGEQDRGPRATPSAGRPFLAPRQGERPGLGVGLARARVLVERHGGVMLVRSTPEGSCVQLTLPRRRSRSALGVA